MKKHLENFAKTHLHDYDELVRFQSVSAQEKQIPETAAYLAEQFENLGADTVEQWTDQSDSPVVFAEFKSKNSDKTVLFYNHYDVQPPEPFDEWKTSPFEPTEKDGHVYGRGIADNKGELISRLVLMKYFQENDNLPVNVKFFVEGEEEIGSLHVAEFVRAHKDQLKADVCVWEGGGKNSLDHYQVVGGMRGIVAFDVDVTTADVDMHSSLASYADSATWRLVEGLSTLRDINGKILVEGFYDDCDELSEAEERVVAESDFDLANAKKASGLKKTVNTEHKTELVNRPTISINGLKGGYQGDGVKTVIPRYASAKLDCRLSPSQDPKKMAELVQKHFDKHGFSDLHVHYKLGEHGYRSNFDHPFVQLTLKEAKDFYGQETKYLLNAAGGGPAYELGNVLEVPTVNIGVSYAGNKVHGPNENIRVNDFYQGVAFLGNVLSKFGQKD